MSSESRAPVADLTGWVEGRFASGGLEYPIFEKGDGPGVILIPEMPGATPDVLGLGQHLVESGFHVVMPSPFGEPGRPQTVGYTLRTLVRVCVSAEFRAFALGAERGFSGWLRALARDVATRTSGPGVGVIGMCFTGGFALAAAVDDTVLAPVMAEPAVPFPISRTRRADPGVSPAELIRVQERTRSDGLCVLGLRFSEDATVPRERFATISSALGDAFEVIELNSRPGNPGGFAKSAHSVLTSEVREVPGNPALAARERTVAFLRERLRS